MAVALGAIFIGLVAVASANAILLLFAFVLATLALAAVTVHFLTNIMVSFPSLKNLGLIDVGLAGSAFVGSAVDLGINWHKL